MRSAFLIGRDGEVATVRQAVANARQNRGGVTLVLGEAGIGKSRLIAEAMRSAASTGMAVLVGRAVEGGGPFRPVASALLAHLREHSAADLERSAELRPFRPALRRILPGWAGADGEETHGVDPVVVLGEGVLRLLTITARDTGCLLVLEDLHWADRDTVLLLEYLASAVPRSAILIMVSSRSDEAQPEALRRLATNRLTLRRLGADSVGRLASACAGGATLPPEVVDFLVGASEGLPFLVEELLTGLVDGGTLDPAAGWRMRGPIPVRVPATLLDLVDRRLASLTATARSVVDAAAVIGRSVDWSVLAPITGLDEDTVVAALRSAVAAYLLAPEASAPARLEWRHALVREAVLTRLLPPQRMRLAARAARALEDHDPDLTGPDAALVADLYERGGDPVRAGGILLRLARTAIAAGALGSADALLARAGTGAMLAGAGTAVAGERVRLLALTGRGEEAIAVGEAALSAPAADDRRVELCLNLARAAITLARWDAADGYLRRAGRPDDPQVKALAADAAYGAGRVDDAHAMAEAAAADAERSGQPAVVCEALEVVGRCVRGADPAAGIAVFRRAADVAEAHGMVPSRIRALFGIGTVEVASDDTSRHFELARDLALDAGMLAEVASIDMILSSSRMVVDGPVAALPDLERCATFARSLRLHQVRAMSLLGVAEAHGVAGRPDAMRAALAEAVRTAPHIPDVAFGAAAAAAVSAILDRDLAGARDLLDKAVAAVRPHPSAAPLHHWGLWALVHTVVGDGSAARAELRGSPHAGRAVNRAGLLYADAVAAGRARDPDTAVALTARGDKSLPAQHWWRRLLTLLVYEAALRDGWGEPVNGLRALLTDFDRAGDARLARTCRDLLRSAGAPVPRRGRGDSQVPARLRAVGVTSREMDVLTLVAQGLTNAQIADRLFLSTRTVENHVANLLAKTRATSRVDLPTALTE
jgi:DNA-binding NarL/FixJ family response regulator